MRTWRFIKRRLVGPIRFFPIYAWMLTLSNLRIAFDVLRPRPGFHPGFVELDLTGYNATERWAAACLISMTPGTLAVDLKDGGPILIVHGLYLQNEEQAVAELNMLLRSALGEPEHESYWTR